MQLSPQRVCLVARGAAGPTGTARYAATLAARLREAGCEVSSLSTRPDGALHAALGTTRALGLDLSTFFSTYPLALPWPRADVYHLTSQTQAAALLFRRPPGPTIVTVHDVIPYLLRTSAELTSFRHSPHSWLDAVAMRGLRRADLLLADSEWTRATLVEHLRVPPSAVKVVPLGVDTVRFRPQAVPDSVWARYGLDPGRTHLLCVSSEDPRKNLTTLWRAFARVRAAVPEAHLLKVGPIHDPAQHRRLVQLADDLGIADGLTILGEVDERELPLLYCLASLSVVPSLFEGFGLPVLESMACGTPVVCAESSALPEVARGAASLVPGTDDAQMAEAIVAILRDRTHAAALATAGIERAARYSWARTVDATRAAYVEAAARRGRAKLSRRPAAPGRAEAGVEAGVWDRVWRAHQASLGIVHEPLLIALERHSGPPGGRRVLEVGAGTAADSASLAAAGDFCVALDFSFEALTAVRRWLTGPLEPALVRADAAQLPFRSAAFEVVFSQGLLEHFRVPAPYLKEQLRVLASGGSVLVDVPQKWSLYTVWKRSLMRRGRWFAGWETEFSLEQLERLVHECGGRVVGTYGYGYFPSLLLGVRNAHTFDERHNMGWRLPTVVREAVEGFWSALERRRWYYRLLANVGIVAAR